MGWLSDEFSQRADNVTARKEEAIQHLGAKFLRYVVAASQVRPVIPDMHRPSRIKQRQHQYVDRLVPLFFQIVLQPPHLFLVLETMLKERNQQAANTKGCKHRNNSRYNRHRGRTH
jgi:hypothetical protein